VDRYADAGASYLTVHVEAARDVPGTLAAIRAHGVRPGLTLNPETPVEAVLPHLGSLDLALVMSVHPGFGGQKFIEGALGKVKAIRAALDDRGLAAELEVDGGVKPENAARLVAAGATVLVAGSAVFEDADGPAAALRKFKEAIRR
jgi:ribulose-phosphate 3-epimerase